jgi:peroxiredoxin
MSTRRSESRAAVPVTLAVAALLLTGCAGESASGRFVNPKSDAAGPGYDSYYGVGEIKFLDSVETNSALDPGLSALSFTSIDGGAVSPADFVGQKPVVLVITRGNTNPICPYCSTQTARLIAAYDEFVQRGVEVVVVYPVEAAADAGKLDAFLANVRTLLKDANKPVPFPVWLDIELKAVDHLGIRKDLSKPATYIIDQAGQVRFGYVGSHLADRPSVQALLEQLDQLVGSESTASVQETTGAAPIGDEAAPGGT